LDKGAPTGFGLVEADRHASSLYYLNPRVFTKDKDGATRRQHSVVGEFVELGVRGESDGVATKQLVRAVVVNDTSERGRNADGEPSNVDRVALFIDDSYKRVLHAKRSHLPGCAIAVEFKLARINHHLGDQLPPEVTSITPGAR
jgi:hypothetical protein